MNQFEASIILWIQENLRGPMDGVVKFITYLGDDGILWIAMGIVLLFWKKTRPIGVTVLLSLLFDYLIINVALKALVARPRPFVVNELITPLVTNVSPYRSFPSGHSGGSFSAMFALYKWVPKRIGIPAIILATMVALSRLYVGVHYPTDIIAGCVIGFICSVLANYIVRRMMKKLEERKANA
ncbi:MAG: phosphatase PAP2 family protein [Tyzzerella sp.]|nr:phosphatase PAP2 family protein [Tyzzerella sp.]